MSKDKKWSETKLLIHTEEKRDSFPFFVYYHKWVLHSESDWDNNDLWGLYNMIVKGFVCEEKGFKLFSSTYHLDKCWNYNN